MQPNLPTPQFSPTYHYTLRIGVVSFKKIKAKQNKPFHLRKSSQHNTAPKKNDTPKRQRNIMHTFSPLNPKFLHLVQAAKEFEEYAQSLPPTEREKALNVIIPGLVPIFKLSGKDELHNHRYRDRALAGIQDNLRNRGKGLHGPDQAPMGQVETKTTTQASKRLTLKTTCGEIDKIHLKDTDPLYMGGATHLIVGIFCKKGNLVFAATLDPQDMQHYARTHIVPKAAQFRTETKDITLKKRDSLSIQMGDIAPYPSFHIEHISPEMDPHPDLVSCITNRASQKALRTHLTAKKA